MNNNLNIDEIEAILNILAVKEIDARNKLLENEHDINSTQGQKKADKHYYEIIRSASLKLRHQEDQLNNNSINSK